MVGLLEHDRAVIAEHGETARRHQLTLIVDLQAAVAGVAGPCRGLNFKKGIAVDGHVERILGRLDRAAGKVVHSRAVLHEGYPTIPAGEVVFMGRGAQIFLKQRPLGLEAGGVDIRDVVRDDVHLPTKRHLPRQSDEKHVLHR